MSYQPALKKKTSKLVNFCGAILISTMEENKQHLRHIMLHHFKEDKNATETQKKMRAVYGEGARTHQMCQKWSVKFRAEDFSLDNAPWSGRPIEVDSDQTEVFTENNVLPRQNIQINKVIGENKIPIFYFTKKQNKTLNGLFGQANT